MLQLGDIQSGVVLGKSSPDWHRLGTRGRPRGGQFDPSG